MKHTPDTTQIKRIQRWIERLENKASTLLDDLPVEEMTPKHQADIALKCLEHLRRFTTTEQALQDALQSEQEQGFLSKLLREARGEQEISEEVEETLASDWRDEELEYEWIDEDLEYALDEMWYGKEESSCECCPRPSRRQ
jgi:hypothetical protein